MSDKEKLELINLRNRLRSQREEIKRLTEENAGLKKKIEYNEQDRALLRSRCLMGVERYFDDHQYCVLKIVTNRHKGGAFDE